MSGDRLVGKVALITGAARGIGAACARRFRREGCALALFDRDEDGLRQIARELGGLAIEGDVTAPADLDRAAAATLAQFGPVTVLVNNAGISITGGVEEISEADWDQTFAVNVKSIYLASRAVIPQMRAAGGGSIVNMASESAFIGFEMHPAYCASKAAVVHLSRSMAARYAREAIRVNALCPGTIDTELYRAFIARQPDPDLVHRQIVAMHPLGIGTPEDIAHAALYLASDESRYTTGAPMLVDGGSTAI